MPSQRKQKKICMFPINMKLLFILFVLGLMVLSSATITRPSKRARISPGIFANLNDFEELPSGNYCGIDILTADDLACLNRIFGDGTDKVIEDDRDHSSLVLGKDRRSSKAKAMAGKSSEFKFKRNANKRNAVVYVSFTIFDTNFIGV